MYSCLIAHAGGHSRECETAPACSIPVLLSPPSFFASVSLLPSMVASSVIVRNDVCLLVTLSSLLRLLLELDQVFRVCLRSSCAAPSRGVHVSTK